MNVLPAPSAAISPVSPKHARVSTERVLFAFTPRERAIFLPELRLEAFDACPHAYIDASRAGVEGWETMLCEWRPTVIVSAWSTRRIPVSWSGSGEMSVRYLCHVAGSVRHVLSRELFDHGLRASNWGTSINHTIAEHAVLLVLALLRGVSRWPESVARGGWTVEQSERLRTKSLRGRKIGLHGFGAIARDVLARLAPFQPAEVKVYSHGVPPAFIAGHGAIPCASLEELFSGSEVLIDCESLSPQNRGSVRADILARLPDDAVFVNVGRGEIVDEDALLREAASGRLRLGIDVFHREPLAPDYPLLHAPGVLVSPHIAGPTWDAYRVCGDHALENLRRYLAGEPLSGEITLAAFDRMT